MNKEQIKLYSVDTKAFYTYKEDKQDKVKLKCNKILKTIKSRTEKELYIEIFEDLELIYDDVLIDEEGQEIEIEIDAMITKNEFNNKVKTVLAENELYTKYKHKVATADKYFNQFVNEFDGVRELNPKYMTLRNQVALFESALTRTMKFKIDEVTDDILILRAYHYAVLEQLVKNGYDFNGKHFCLLTASAGQMRTKKAVFVNVELWVKYEKTLLCGLTIKDINESDELGFNLGKFLAYVALNNSSTDEWTKEQGFDIDKVIVIEDFESMVWGKVDYIDVNHMIKEPNERSLTKEERKKVSEKVSTFRSKLDCELKEIRNDKAAELKSFREQTKSELKYDENKEKYSIERDEKLKEYIESNKLLKKQDSDIIKQCKSVLNEEFDELMKPLRDTLKERISNYRNEELRKYDIQLEYKQIEINTKVRKYKSRLEQYIKGYNEVCDFPIERKEMFVPVPHSDGCGWVLPSLSDKNFMFRLPWCKGLLAVNDFIKYCKSYRKKFVDGEWVDDKGNYMVTDIYKQEHDVRNVSIILSKSQFKAWKYYKSWEHYKECFKQYDCKANKCKIERDEFKKASLNYQMFQSITDMTDEEIEHFTNPVTDFINKGYTDVKTQQEMIGAFKNQRNNLQQAIRMYPEMLQEYHVREQLSQDLNKKKKQAKFSKFKVDAKYTFIIPDVLAWNEFVFDGNANPKGILADGEVSCKLFKEDKLCVNRSPSLYRELGVRKNIANDKDRNTDIKRWLTTNAVYTSSHDLISKLLNFDSDGDESLVISHSKYVEIAERNMKDIVPLYYPMSKAKAQIINNDNLYKALVDGYKFSNIGQYSNKITNMWNEDGEVDLDAIKILTCLNNFFIDGAKTGYMIEPSKAIKEKLKKADGKSPYFFQFAKDKEEHKVKPINNSTVNRICKKIEEIGQGDYDFSKLGKFKYTTLLVNDNPNVDEEARKELIKEYRRLDNRKNIIFAQSSLPKEDIWKAVFDDIKTQMSKKANELDIAYLDMVDIIVKDVYVNNKDSRKTTIWEVFGTTIIETMRINIKKPVEEGEFILCEDCGKHIKNEKNKKYCPVCSKKRTAERNRNRK